MIPLILTTGFCLVCRRFIVVLEVQQSSERRFHIGMGNSRASLSKATVSRVSKPLGFGSLSKLGIGKARVYVTGGATVFALA